MKYLLMIFTSVALVACDCDMACQYEKAHVCDPIVVSVAPDGTTLYRVSYSCPKVSGYDVYFSKSGTQTSHTVLNGKIRKTVIDEVPNSYGE